MKTTKKILIATILFFMLVTSAIGATANNSVYNPSRGPIPYADNETSGLPYASFNNMTNNPNIGDNRGFDERTFAVGKTCKNGNCCETSDPSDINGVCGKIPPNGDPQENWTRRYFYNNLNAPAQVLHENDVIQLELYFHNNGSDQYDDNNSKNSDDAEWVQVGIDLTDISPLAGDPALKIRPKGYIYYANNKDKNGNLTGILTDDVQAMLANEDLTLEIDPHVQLAMRKLNYNGLDFNPDPDYARCDAHANQSSCNADMGSEGHFCEWKDGGCNPNWGWAINSEYTGMKAPGGGGSNGKSTTFTDPDTGDHVTVNSWAYIAAGNKNAYIYFDKLPGCFRYSGFAYFKARVVAKPKTCQSITVNKPAHIYTYQTAQISAHANRPASEGGGVFNQGGMEYSLPTGGGKFYTSQYNADNDIGGVTTIVRNPDQAVFFRGTVAGSNKIKIDTLGTAVAGCTSYISVETNPTPQVCTNLSVTNINTNQALPANFKFDANGLYSLKASTSYSLYDPLNRTSTFKTSRGYLTKDPLDALGLIAKALSGGDPTPASPPLRTVTAGENEPVYFLAYNDASGGQALEVKANVPDSQLGPCSTTYYMSEIPVVCEQLYVNHHEKILSETTSEFEAIAFNSIDATMTNKIQYSLIEGGSGSFYAFDPGDPQNPFSKQWSPNVPPNAIYEFSIDLFQTTQEVIDGFAPLNMPLSFFENAITETQKLIASIGEYAKASLFSISDMSIDHSILSSELTDTSALAETTLLGDQLFLLGSNTIEADPNSTIYFIGNSSVGKVKVKTKNVSGISACEQAFPIYAPVCKTINVTSTPNVGTQIHTGETVTFTAGSTWGLDNKAFNNTKTQIHFRVSEAEFGYLYTTNPNNHVYEVTVNPGTQVKFVALQETGEDVLTIDVIDTEIALCTETYDIIPAPPTLCTSSSTTFVPALINNELATETTYTATTMNNFGTTQDLNTTYTINNVDQPPSINGQITFTTPATSITIDNYLKARATNDPSNAACKEEFDLVVTSGGQTCISITPDITELSTGNKIYPGDTLKESDRYTISNDATYSDEANMDTEDKKTIYTVISSGDLVDVSSNTDLPSPQTLPNNFPIYFDTDNVDDNTEENALEIKSPNPDGTLNPICKETYKIKTEGGDEDSYCTDLEIISPDTSPWEPEDNQYFQVSIDGEGDDFDEDNYKYEWEVYGGGAYWNDTSTTEDNNRLQITDIDDLDHIKVLAINKGDSGDVCPVPLYYTSSGSKIHKKVREVSTPTSAYEDQIIITGSSTDEIQYKVTITNDGSDELKFEDTGFDSQGRIYGKYLMNDKSTKNDIDNGYLEFISVVIKDENGTTLGKCPSPMGSNTTPCYTNSDLNASFGKGQTVTLKNIDNEDTITIEYKVENHSATTSDSKCSQMIANTGCGEIFENTIELYDSSNNQISEDTATVIALCPYIITRGSGDVFFHNELIVGADLTCAGLKNSLGIIIKPKYYPEYTPNTGTGDSYDPSGNLTETTTLVTGDHDVCKPGNSDVPSEYNNPFKNFSSSICEMESDVSKVWREPIINNAIQNNAEKLGRWSHIPANMATTYGLDSEQVMNKQGVVVIDGDVTIPITGLQIEAELGKRPAGQTYIIKGNLTINGDIMYNDSNVNVTSPSSLPSVAFIVINGDITIKNSVEKLDGIYVALSDPTVDKGKFLVFPSNTTETSTQLIIRGSLVGDVSNLFQYRRAPGNPKKDEGAIVINYDERLILNTPPGLGNFLDLSQMKVPHKF